MVRYNGNKGKGRQRGRRDYFGEKRELLLKGEEQEYAQVLKMLGNGRMDVMCVDGVRRLCHIRGKLRKKVWINAGDIILVSLRSFQDAKADALHKYNVDEIRELIKNNEIPETFKLETKFDNDNVYDMENIGFESDASAESIDLDDL